MSLTNGNKTSFCIYFNLNLYYQMAIKHFLMSTLIFWTYFQTVQTWKWYYSVILLALCLFQYTIIIWLVWAISFIDSSQGGFMHASSFLKVSSLCLQKQHTSMITFRWCPWREPRVHAMHGRRGSQEKGHAGRCRWADQSSSWAGQRHAAKCLTEPMHMSTFWAYLT